VGAAYQRFEANRSAADADDAERRVSVAELAAGGSGDRQAPGEGLVAAMAAVPSLYFQEHFSLSRRAAAVAAHAVNSLLYFLQGFWVRVCALSCAFCSQLDVPDPCVHPVGCRRRCWQAC